MKVILLGATPPPIGGIATWTLRMLDVCHEFDIKYSLVDEKMIGLRNMFGNNKRNIFDEGKRCIRIWRDLIKTIKKDNPDIVQSCIPASTLSMIREYICAIISKKYNKKFVLHLHCTVPNMQGGYIWRRMLMSICKRSDAIFVLNTQSYKFIKEITSTQVKVIPNFVAEKEVSVEHNIRTNIKTILYVGGVVESKGVLDIIKVAKRNKDKTFRLVGNVDKKVRAIAENEENIILTGPLSKNEVNNELKNADIFMFLSKFKGEGFSMALLEAMSAGLPCIVTDWAANKDMIDDKGGVTITNYSIDEICNAINKIQDKKIRKIQSDRNINEVKSKYVSSIIFNTYYNAYREILSNNLQ